MTEQRSNTVKQVASGRVNDRMVFTLGTTRNQRITVLLMALRSEKTDIFTCLVSLLAGQKSYKGYCVV